MVEREQGRVKWFDPDKGYGFIERDSGGDIFVHWKSVQMDGYVTLTENQRVEFEVAHGPKGAHAKDVVPV